tara:strand:- start:4076 stop:5221 length:1146 start_codon:yes stop_codon:yes gene_type:complete
MVTSNQDPFLIIGGGLIGLSMAHQLALKGLKVEVLSRRRSEAAGFVAAGMLAPHAEGLSGKLLTLGQLSLAKIPKWVSEIEHNSGIECGLKKCGIIVPFTNTDERDKYPTSQFGKKLTKNELIKEIPGIASHWDTGLLFEQDGQIDNRRQLMRALEKACVSLGVHFQEGVEVLEILQHKQQLEGVNIRTAEGELKIIYGKKAVLCNGAWGQKLLKELPIFPIKGQMLSLQGPKNTIQRVIFGPGGTYLVPREDGLIVVGATSEKNAGFNEGLTPFGQKQLQEGIKSLLPKASNWPHMERWWGFRPATPDASPILGPSTIQGLWLACGHNRNGVLLAAITAEIIQKIIMQEMLDKSKKDLLSEFSLNRFRKIKNPIDINTIS